MFREGLNLSHRSTKLQTSVLREAYPFLQAHAKNAIRCLGYCQAIPAILDHSNEDMGEKEQLRATYLETLL